MSKGRWVLFKSRHGSFVIPEVKLAEPRVQLLFKTKDIKIMATVPTFLKRRSPRPRIQTPRLIKPVKMPASRPITPAGRVRYRVKRRRVFRRTKLSGIELKHLKAMPGKLGISSFDTHAHIDKTLTYAENKTQIERKLRNIARVESVYSMDQFQSDLDTHMHGLEARAKSGNVHAIRELQMWRRERKNVRVV